MSEKIVQTAGRDALGEFAPEFAHFNDDVLFGENWNNGDIDLKTRSIITVVALMAQGITDNSLKFPHPQCEEPWRDTKRDGGSHHPHRFLCRLAQGVGGVQPGERGLRAGVTRLPRRPCRSAHYHFNKKRTAPDAASGTVRFLFVGRAALFPRRDSEEAAANFLKERTAGKAVQTSCPGRTSFSRGGKEASKESTSASSVT